MILLLSSQQMTVWSSEGAVSQRCLQIVYQVIQKSLNKTVGSFKCNLH